ncbi:MAG TPA: hypothetical protein DCL63_09545 [Firmicutes bacterium]|nr:hypothetical protein [Bacillota bacterium]
MRQDTKAAQRADVAKAAAAATPRPLTFWEQYRRKSQGMVGLAMVAIYVLVAVFAPWIAPYNPMDDLYLADASAAPVWMSKLSARFRNCPPTIRFRLGLENWNQEELGGATLSSFAYEEESGIQFDLPATASAEPEAEEDAGFSWVRSVEWNPWGSQASEEPSEEEPAAGDVSAEGVVLSYVTPYQYKTPNTFSTKFEYSIDAPDTAETLIMVELVTPDGQAHDLWDTTVAGSTEYGSAIVDSRDFDLKIRLGMSFFGEPSQVLFAEKGDYTIRLRVSATSPDGPVSLKMSPVAFEVLGMVHGVLGVDHMGSDLWSQLIYGTRIALAIGLSTAFIAVAIGTTVGIVAGYVGGAVDEFLMRVADVLLAIPSLPILIILGALFGKSVLNIVILLALLSWMGIARLVRSQTLSLKERQFVEAARASGASQSYVMLQHVLPNVMPLIFANLVLRIPGAILTEASLSFLGLGDPRVCTWGRILQNAREFGAFTTMAWWWLVPPGLALTFMSLAFVFIGNSVNEILNPRYRERS